MRRGFHSNHWSANKFPRNVESSWWRQRKSIEGIHTRSGLITALPAAPTHILSSESDSEVRPGTPVKPEPHLESEEEMARLEIDPKLSELMGHVDEDPPTPIILKATRTNALKRQVSEIKQRAEETFYGYWTRFKKLVDSFPNHKYVEGDLIHYFYQDMNVETKNLINSSSGGDFEDKRLSEAREILKRLVEATRAYDEPSAKMLKSVANVSEISDELEERFETKLGRLEKLILKAVDKVSSSSSTERKPEQQVLRDRGGYQYPPQYYPPDGMEDVV